MAATTKWLFDAVLNRVGGLFISLVAFFMSGCVAIILGGMSFDLLQKKLCLGEHIFRACAEPYSLSMLWQIAPSIVMAAGALPIGVFALGSLCNIVACCLPCCPYIGPDVFSEPQRRYC